MILDSKDLSPDQRATIEHLLGRQVTDAEHISIRAFEPPSLAVERKHELAERLKAYFAEIDSRRQQGSVEEAEDIIDEAMRSVRLGYRTHQ